MIPKVKALPYILPSVSTANEGNEENVATAPYTRKAPYQYGWDWGPRYVTIGIWKPVCLETWDSGSHREPSHSSAEDRSRCRRSWRRKSRSSPVSRQTATITISADNAGGAIDECRNVKPSSSTPAPTTSRFLCALLRQSCGIPQDTARRIAIASRHRSKIGKVVDRASRGQDRTAFRGTASRAGSVGQELYLRRERNSDLRQGSERHSLRQLSQPGHARSLSPDSDRPRATPT